MANPQQRLAEIWRSIPVASDGATLRGIYTEALEFEVTSLMEQVNFLETFIEGLYGNWKDLVLNQDTLIKQVGQLWEALAVAHDALWIAQSKTEEQSLTEWLNERAGWEFFNIQVDEIIDAALNNYAATTEELSDGNV